MPHLDVSADEFRRVADRVTELAAEFLESLEEGSTFPATSAADTAALELPAPDGPFETPQDLAPLLGPVPASAAGSGPRGLSSAGDDTADHPSMLNPPDAT